MQMGRVVKKQAIVGSVLLDILCAMLNNEMKDSKRWKDNARKPEFFFIFQSSLKVKLKRAELFSDDDEQMQMALFCEQTSRK